MAKRKAARAVGRKATRTRGGSSRSMAGRGKTGARKAVSRKNARAGPRKAARKATARKPAARKATARGSSARTRLARKTAAKKTAARRVPPKTVVARKAPNLDRERRTVQEDDRIGSVPSSLDLDRRASAARTGRRELRERFDEHTETSPQLTGGDVDADWESAYSVGDEAPGGDNPTPDQDIVDDIGRAVGVEYQDNEELKGADKVARRDKHRWELDPASAEDYDDRD